MAFAETANLVVKLTLGGNFTSQMAKARSSLRGFDRDASRAYKAGSQIGTGIKRSLAIGAAAATGFAVLLGKSIDAAGDFEASLNTINTIARATPEALDKIGDAVRKVAKDTGTPLEDLTQGYYDLLSAGIKAADAQDVLVQSNKLAIGGLSTTAEAIDLLTTAINTYGGDASQAAKDADIFAKAVERGKVTAAEIAGSFATVGPLSAAYSIGIDEIGASYARLTAAGVPAAEAATQMRSAIQSLAKPDKALRKLEGITKKSYLSIAGKQGLVVALQQMRTDAEKNGIPLSLLTSRIEAMQFLLQTTGPNFAAYQADLAAMGDAAGTAAGQMAEREKGLNFQLGKLTALAKDAGITIGTALLPKLTPMVAQLNNLINTHQGDISAFGDQLAAAFTPEGVVDGIKSIGAALGPMIDLLKIAAAPVKAIVDAFLKLPKEVQTVLVGAFAVNKLTGGLVTNAAGGIIEAIGKGLLGGIKAPLVNVQGGVVNVAGGIPGGGIPGGLGGAAGIGAAAGLGIAGAVTVGGLIAAVNSPLWVRNSALNTRNENAGLTQAERAAQTYYTASAADQAQMRKHILVMPTLADFQSGSIKLSSGSAGSASSIISAAQIVVAPMSKSAAKAAASAALAAAAARSAASASMRRDAAPSVSTTVNVKVAVTASGISKTVTTQSRYGPATGSSSGDPRFLGYTPGL
jgi:TP901 family phage tail tape measure protein